MSIVIKYANQMIFVCNSIIFPAKITQYVQTVIQPTPNVVTGTTFSCLRKLISAETFFCAIDKLGTNTDAFSLALDYIESKNFY